MTDQQGKQEHNKNNYKDNQDHIKAKRNELFTCECGNTCLTTHKARHIKSKKHIKFMEDKTCQPVVA